MSEDRPREVGHRWIPPHLRGKAQANSADTMKDAFKPGLSILKKETDSCSEHATSTFPSAGLIPPPVSTEGDISKESSATPTSGMPLPQHEEPSKLGWKDYIPPHKRLQTQPKDINLPSSSKSSRSPEWTNQGMSLSPFAAYLNDTITKGDDASERAALCPDEAISTRISIASIKSTKTIKEVNTHPIGTPPPWIKVFQKEVRIHSTWNNPADESKPMSPPKKNHSQKQDRSAPTSTTRTEKKVKPHGHNRGNKDNPSARLSESTNLCENTPEEPLESQPNASSLKEKIGVKKPTDSSKEKSHQREQQVEFDIDNNKLTQTNNANGHWLGHRSNNNPNPQGGNGWNWNRGGIWDSKACGRKYSNGRGRRYTNDEDNKPSKENRQEDTMRRKEDRQASRQDRWPKIKKQAIYENSLASWETNSPDKAWEPHGIDRLVNWEGKWAPPPEDWEGRVAFMSETLERDIESWLKRQNDWVKIVVNQDAIVNHWDKAIVPRTWIPEKLEGVNLSEFWANLIGSSLQPIDWEDLDNKPWWDGFLHSNSCFLKTLVHPMAKLDQDDLGTRMDQKTSKKSIEEAIEKQKKRRKRERERQKQWQEEVQDMEKIIASTPNTIGPKANIYLRPAVAADIPQIVSIYNHYIENTWCVAERRPMTRATMLHRLNKIDEDRLPWIVVVERSNKFKVRGANWKRSAGNEKILGYGFADDHNSRVGQYRFTAEIEIFIHPEHLRNGCGKSLLDRLLFLLERGYQMKGDTSWIGESNDSLRYPRVFHRIIINVPYVDNSDDRVRATWIREFISRYGFEKFGDMNEIGCRKGKGVNVALFIRKCKTNYIDIQTIPELDS